MNYSELKIIQLNFLHELQDAFAGKKTSLLFITQNHSSIPIVKNGEVFEVLVIGGSVWKKALLQKTKTGIEIVKKEAERPVAFKNQKDFLEFIESGLTNEVTTLALNFATPMKPVFENGRLDGIVLSVPKEGKLNELIGKKVGAEIEKYIFEKQKRRIKASVANDTVCLVLSGLTKYRWNQFVAGIVGTGVNFAFFLNEEKIANLESANFDKFILSQEASVIDKESSEPNIHLFEKETAGAYLYKHFNIIIKDRKIDYPFVNSTEELNDLSLKVIPKVSSIAFDLIKRSAQMVSCQIAGILLLRQAQDQNDKKDGSMVFNMEGSLFWKGNQYKETVMQTVKQLIPNYGVEFVEIKNSGILGAAKLVS